MDEKNLVRELRSRNNPVGAALLIYYGIMNFAVLLVTALDLLFFALRTGNWNMFDLMDYMMRSMTSNGLGYLISIAIGALIVLLWKKPAFWRDEIFARDKKMDAASFLQLLCVFLCGQAILQLMVPVLEWVLNQVGLSALAAMEAASIQSTGVTMFLYITILGPIAEELLFRGLILRLLRHCGKQGAIVFSALLFGLFHGNVVQIPFAFLVGLVLGYTAAEYSIVWAMVLHIINNLVLSDLMGRLSEILPAGVGDGLFYGLMIFAAIATIVILIIRRAQVKQYLQENRIHPLSAKAFFTSPAVLVFGILMLLSSLLTITPI